METIEYFSQFLQNLKTPNILVIAIVLILLWILISGIRKGLKKDTNDKSSEDNGNEDEV